MGVQKEVINKTVQYTVDMTFIAALVLGSSPWWGMLLILMFMEAAARNDRQNNC